VETSVKHAMPSPRASFHSITSSARLSSVAGTSRLARKDSRASNNYVKGYEVSTSFGLGAPRGTSETIVDKLNKDRITLAHFTVSSAMRFAKSAGEPVMERASLRPSAIGPSGARQCRSRRRSRKAR
jgi:hypothetical protein